MERRRAAAGAHNVSDSDFLLIRPVAVTDAILTSSTIPETVAATYAGGTTYAAGALAGPAPVVGQAQSIWKSLQAGNTGNAQVEGVWWTFVASVYPAYDVAQAYVVGDYAQDNTTHLIYKKLTNGTGDALTNATKWELIGATNKWAMFDSKYQTISSQWTSIQIVLTPGVIITSVALLNATGASATILQSVSGYTETILLYNHDVLSWWEWYYETPIRTGEAVFDQIPPYAASTLTITVDNTGGTASVGVLVIGKEKRLGATQWEASRTINDYSRAVEAADGTVSLTVGNYSKRLNVEVFIDAGFESEATRILEEFRATPLVFVGSSLYSMTIIYGWLGGWYVPISTTGRPASIEIKGLV
jgi:hypothetical protein